MKTWHFVIRGSVSLEDNPTEEQVRFYLNEQIGLQDQGKLILV